VSRAEPEVKLAFIKFLFIRARLKQQLLMSVAHRQWAATDRDAKLLKLQQFSSSVTSTQLSSPFDNSASSNCCH
jgi:hypothetical protein